jgi:hypothetical protein
VTKSPVTPLTGFAASDDPPRESLRLTTWALIALSAVVALGAAGFFRRSYDHAYRSAYGKAFEQAGVKPPGRITVHGD